ncbi:MAG TPA: hypothetical protein VLG92_04355 [Candidatus Saccharimonadia bacterium]|nr:hypothetical protein [Candidatus Saccharimonadia bacterium]
MSLEYITPGEAYELAGQRLRDESLQERAAAYLGRVWPMGFEEMDEPTAVYAPYLGKGTETELKFLRQAGSVGFKTTVATYEEAEYVTANPGLVDCYRAPLKLPKGQQERRWIVPEAARSGAVGNTPTVYADMAVANYWRGLRTPVLEENRLPIDDMVVDFGSWYAYQASRFGWAGERSKSPFYYRAAMALYASGRAVLFDTPPTTFADRVMVPAYTAVADALGVGPLLTNTLNPGKRDWTDISFLDENQLDQLRASGRIKG